jgi:acetyl esterase/lipase
VDAFGVADLVRQQGMVVPPGVSLKRGRKILFDPRRQQARGASPIEVVERIRAPLLVAHGANDPRVSVEQSEDVVAAIRAAGGCVEYVLYPDEGHGFIHRRNRLDFWARVERFLARHLCGAAAIDQQRPGGVSPRARSRS